ncbi:piggyBac transposable element-derived protein 4-like isoform X6 [Xyrichtys novacula]|uniref:PiggyBac transposable element-derived protein 4-like isoform X6 n=1 Tax=Xyrichtys novacula TaxID=13765 RepID=A0AAV1FQZ1_XYRNO|nr:piggyBac transposable element-derived protein 4-like isoform X6 [Xyrichtys novacula]
MLRRSARKRRLPAQFVEEEEKMEMQEEAGGVSPSQTQDSSDEGPSKRTRRGRSLVCGRRRQHSSSSGGPDAAGDAPACHSPQLQKAWKTEADPDPHPTSTWEGKTRRWPMTVFQHLVDTAATNSYILHKEISVTQKRKLMTHQAFQEKLCAELLGVPLNPPPKPPPPPTQGCFPAPPAEGSQWRKGRETARGENTALPGSVKSVELYSAFN